MATVMIVVGIVGGIVGVVGKQMANPALARESVNLQVVDPAQMCTLAKNLGEGNLTHRQMAQAIHAALGCTLVQPTSR